MQGKQISRKSPSRLATGSAALLLIFLLAGVAARFWITDRAYDFTGPVHIAAGGSDVYVDVSGEILHLSADGDLLGQQDLQAIGLPADPIDLRLLDNGDLLIAGQRPASIHVCNPELWTCRPLGSPVIAKIQRQFKILPLEMEGQWLLTDARGDALWLFDESKATLGQALPAGTLAGPNGLAAGAGGTLWVADTDNKRIVELVPLGDGTYTTGREHSAVNDLTRAVSYYPMMIEGGLGERWWVIQAAEFSVGQADLVVYDTEEGAIDVVAMPGGSYPTDIVALDGDLLVTDIEQFEVSRVNGVTRAVSSFGDDAFKQRLEHLSSQHAMYNRLSTAVLAATIAIAVLLIFVAVRATPKERRWSQAPDLIDLESAAETVPEIRGTHWLERNPKMSWLTKRLERIFYVLFGLLCLVSILLYAVTSSLPLEDAGKAGSATGSLGLTFVLATVALAGFIPIMYLSSRVLNRRVGTDGVRIHFELENGRRLSLLPDQVTWNKRALLYRQYTFPIRTGWKHSLYAAGEVETWLAPLLRQSPRISEWQTLVHQWKNRDPLILVSAAVVVYVGILIALIEMFSFGRA